MIFHCVCVCISHIISQIWAYRSIDRILARIHIYWHHFITLILTYVHSVFICYQFFRFNVKRIPPSFCSQLIVMSIWWSSNLTGYHFCDSNWIFFFFFIRLEKNQSMLHFFFSHLSNRLTSRSCYWCCYHCCHWWWWWWYDRFILYLVCMFCFICFCFGYLPRQVWENTWLNKRT